MKNKGMMRVPCLTTIFCLYELPKLPKHHVSGYSQAFRMIAFLHNSRNQLPHASAHLTLSPTVYTLGSVKLPLCTFRGDNTFHLAHRLDYPYPPLYRIFPSAEQEFTSLRVELTSKYPAMSNIPTHISPMPATFPFSIITAISSISLSTVGKLPTLCKFQICKMMHFVTCRYQLFCVDVTTSLYFDEKLSSPVVMIFCREQYNFSLHQ